MEGTCRGHVVWEPISKLLKYLYEYCELHSQVGQRTPPCLTCLSQGVPATHAQYCTDASHRSAESRGSCSGSAGPLVNTMGFAAAAMARQQRQQQADANGFLAMSNVNVSLPMGIAPSPAAGVDRSGASSVGVGCVGAPVASTARTHHPNPNPNPNPNAGESHGLGSGSKHSSHRSSSAALAAAAAAKNKRGVLSRAATQLMKAWLFQHLVVCLSLAFLCILQALSYSNKVGSQHN